MNEHSPNTVPRSGFLDMMGAGVLALAMHPAIVVAYIALVLALSFTDIWLHTLVGGPLPGPDAGREIVLRYIAAGFAIQIVRVPFDSILDAGVLSAASLACRNERVSARLVMQGIYRYVTRMFLMNVVFITLFALSVLCPPLILVATYFIRFLTVYIVSEDVSVAVAFRKGASTVFNRDSWFLPLYLIATLCSVIVMFGIGQKGGNALGISIKVLGYILLIYVDLVVICTSFLLFRRMRSLKEHE